MISGVYLGEIARLVLQGMAQESDVFGSSANFLSIPFIFRYPPYICESYCDLNYRLIFIVIIFWPVSFI